MPEATNKHSVEIGVFDGGLNTKAQELALPLNQSPSMYDWVYDDYGALTLRKGYKTHNSNPIANAPFDGLFSFKPNTMSALLLAVCDGSAYVKTGAATAFNLIASSQSLFTGSIPCEIVQFQELAFLSNGDQQPYKFNGREFTRAGVSAPAQALSAACNAAGGNLNGTYTYVYTGVNSYLAEGDYGGTSPSRAIVSGTVRVSNIPTAPGSHGIESWNVYRNTAGVQGVYYKITNISNGVTSFTDNVADSALLVEASTDQGYLRKFAFLMQTAGRLWGVVDDFLWFSEANQPETFPSGNNIRVGRGDGMQISSIAAFKGMVVISKSDFNGRTAIYQLLIGDSVSVSDPSSWYLNLISEEGGGESQRAVVPYSSYLLLFNRKGAYAFNGAGVSLAQNPTRAGSVVSDTISENVEDNLRSSTLAYQALLRGAAAIVWKNKIWLAFDIGDRVATSHPTTQVVNSELYQFDFTRISDSKRKGGAWSKLNLVNPFGIAKFVIHEGALYVGASGYQGQNAGRSGTLYELDSSDLDGGTIHGAEYRTAPLQGKKGHEGFFKDFRHLFLTCKGVGALNVYYTVDGEAATDTFGSQTFLQQITLSASIQRIRMNLPNPKGKRIYFVFYGIASQAGETCTIFKMELIYTLRGLRNG